MGIVGAKALLLIMYPIVFIGIYYLLYIKSNGIKPARDLVLITAICLFSAVLGAAIIKYQPRLNKERIVGGEINLDYTYEYIKNYNVEKMPDNPSAAAGRISTLQLVIETLLKGGVEQFCIGYGPGSLTRSILDSSAVDKRILNIAGSYGNTGMTYILTEYGFFGFILISLMFVIFSLRSLRWFKIENDSYWKAIAAGTVVFTFYEAFIFFAYNVEPIIGDLMPPIYFFAMASMYYRLRNLRNIQKVQEGIERPIPINLHARNS